MFAELPVKKIREVFVSETFYETCSSEVREKIGSVPNETVSDAVFSRISDTRTPQGIFAIAEQNSYTLEDILKNPSAAHILILETVQDPGNLGTMFRAGEGAGLTGIIMDCQTADLYNPKVIRSTMGSIFRVPFFRTEDLPGTIKTVKQAGIRVIAAHLNGSVSYTEEDYLSPTAFMIGNEAAGLKAETADLADTRVRIPMLGEVESLNAAVAASVLMFELARQRRNHGM